MYIHTFRVVQKDHGAVASDGEGVLEGLDERISSRRQRRQTVDLIDLHSTKFIFMYGVRYGKQAGGHTGQWAVGKLNITSTDGGGVDEGAGTIISLARNSKRLIRRRQVTVRSSPVVNIIMYSTMTRKLVCTRT